MARIEICTSCDYPVGNWTYVRQRIVCRRCWELMGRDLSFDRSTPGKGEEE